MIIIISLILILLYCGCYWLYKYYRNEYQELEKHILRLEIEFNKEIKEMKKKYQINEQLINWLYDEINRKNDKR